MRKIIEYRIVSRHTDTIKEFLMLINDRLDEGWQPYGSFSVDTHGNLFQPIVRYEDTAPLKIHPSDICEHVYSSERKICTLCHKPMPPPLRNSPR